MTSGPFAIKSQHEFTVGAGPLNVLTESPYDFKKTQYPTEGLGSTVPSYVVFYVNLPDSAKFKLTGENYVENAFSISDQNIQNSRGATNPKLVSGGLGTALGIGLTTAAISAGRDFAGVIRSGRLLTGLENAGEGAGAAGIRGAAGGVIAGFAQSVDKKPKMQRIKEAVAIYMPDTVMHTYSHDYDVQSLTAAMGDVGKAQRGGSGTIEAIKNAFTSGDPVNPQASAGFTELMGDLAQETGQVGAGFTDFLLRNKGLALNPQVELLFKGTANRGFIFDFKFQPKNQKEAETINNIIFIFRRYAAPTLSATVTDPGAYFIPPAQFDIQYYFKNQENKFIGRISTCVLENIDINYSSAGQYATFNDGAPIEINMQLRFKEVDIITRNMIDQGF
jgi:hypothetical protein